MNNHILAQRLPPPLPESKYLVIDEEHPDCIYATDAYEINPQGYAYFKATHQIEDHGYPIGCVATPYVAAKTMMLVYYTVVDLHTTVEEYASALTKEKYPML